MLLFILFLILFLISGSILLTRLLIIIHKHNVADRKLKHAKEEEYLNYRAECEKQHEPYLFKYTWFDSQCLKRNKRYLKIYLDSKKGLFA